MTYTKTTWTSSVPLSVTNLNHMETQYADIITDLGTHNTNGHSIYYTKTEMENLFWGNVNDGTGSGFNADKLGGEEAAAITSGIPSGFMCWWNPENGAIPTGYVFCNGENGTYDMRDKYPVGAGTVSVGNITGNAFITPECNVTIAQISLSVGEIFHTHNYVDYYSYHTYAAGSMSAAGYYTDTTLTPESASIGGGGTHNHPAVFTGNALYLDPIYRYLVIMQKT